MIKSVLGSDLDPTLHRLFPWLFRRELDPNTLTVCGTVVSLGAAWLLAEGAFQAAAGVILFGGFFDLVDGVVARHRGISSRFGAFLDSTLDRVVDMALFTGLCVHYARIGEPGGVLLAAYTLSVAALVSYAQAKAEQTLPGFRIGLMERAERIVVLAAGALMGFMVPALAIIALGSTITAGQRFAKARRDMAKLDAEG